MALWSESRVSMALIGLRESILSMLSMMDESFFSKESSPSSVPLFFCTTCTTLLAITKMIAKNSIEMVVRVRIKSAAKLQKSEQNTKQKQFFSHDSDKKSSNLALNYSFNSKNYSKNICFNQIFRNFAAKILILKIQIQ